MWGVPEGRHWVEVAADRCPDCGLEAGRLDREGVGPGLVATASRWARLLGGAGGQDLRARPADGAWSALECGAHVAGVLEVFGSRIGRVLVTDDPELGWWDHEGAVAAERYNAQDPGEVAARVERRAGEVAALLASVAGGQWARAGTRRAGERFTVEALGRFVLHEAHHHHADAGRALVLAQGIDVRRPQLLALVAARRLNGPVDDRERAAIGAIEAAVSALDRPFDEDGAPTHVTSSAIITGPAGVLLLEHKRLGIWVQPGGHLDPAEDLAAGAQREAIEETGLAVSQPSAGPWMVHVDVHDGGRGHTHLDLRWALGAAGDPNPPPGESQRIGWFGWDQALALADPGLAGALRALRPA
jgi:8-oxo-dGTP pyrophosphatase MutT (NUDIX family)